MASKKVGKYLLEEEIGAGMFGQVFRGRNTQTDEIIAVKVINRAALNEKTMIQIEREISVMKGVNSPYLIKLYDVLKTAKNLYMFLEFCSGGDLEGYMKKNGPVTENLARKWMG
jgi:serine/threonine-protein kinase ULK/ATG1